MHSSRIAKSNRLLLILGTALSLSTQELLAAKFLSAKTVDAKIERNLCEHIFRILTDNNVQPETVHWGELNQIPLVMQNAGYPKAFAKEFIEHLKSVLDNKEQIKDPILQSALKIWQQRKSDLSKVVFCFANCPVVNNERGAMVAGFILTGTVPKSQLGREIGPADLDAIEKVYRHHFTNESPMLIFTQNTELTPKDFATYALHELTHLANFEFRDTWIYSNIRLLRRLEKPDDLFRKNIRFQDGVLRVNEGFHLAFEEGRAMWAELLAEAMMSKPSLSSADLKVKIQSEIWNRLHTLYPSSAHEYLRDNGITEESLVNWLENTEKLMQESISRPNRN